MGKLYMLRFCENQICGVLATYLCIERSGQMVFLDEKASRCIDEQRDFPSECGD